MLIKSTLIKKLRGSEIDCKNNTSAIVLNDDLLAICLLQTSYFFVIMSFKS